MGIARTGKGLGLAGTMGLSGTEFLFGSVRDGLSVLGVVSLIFFSFSSPLLRRPLPRHIKAGACLSGLRGLSVGVGEAMSELAARDYHSGNSLSP
ncbi:hypothetical protein VTJ04DRAFT_2543 [Mycothermus thermophilus]|uniref:uncharacterized protein n=1 Tax=Humicola insolens TaxID=85995 RepID=UPI0037433A63